MATQPLSPGDFWRPLQVEGRSRHYLVHVPPSYHADRPIPVVLAFHGATSNARLMEKFSGLTAKADDAGFLLVYPNGTGNSTTVLTWNGGNGYGYAHKHNVNDIAYTHALLDDLAQVANLDPRRIYLTGMSNGAQMAYRLAAEAPERFAAVAAIAGPLGRDVGPPRQPMRVLHIHGLDDQFAPFQGGKGPKSIYGAEFLSVEATVRAWVRVNECPNAPVVTELPTRHADGTRIVRKYYGPGRQGSEVIVYEVAGGGHTWPGRDPLPPSLGVSTQNLNANNLIWEFFGG